MDTTMDTTKERTPLFDTGMDFWRDTAASFGLEEAAVICVSYFGTQIRTEDPQERQFCRELFAAMYEATAAQTDPGKIVYPYSLATARDRLELSHYHASREQTGACAKDIDAAIHASCYRPNFYNLEAAAHKVLAMYGFERVATVLAHNLQTRGYDGRFSTANKQWADGIEPGGRGTRYSDLSAHPILIDGFASKVREMYAEVGAERFALPGREEDGAAAAGYNILRSITFDNRRGFAIGHNSAATQPFVTWQFTQEGRERDFYWGHYFTGEAAVQDNYRARVAVYMRDEDAKEIFNPLAAAEMSVEQNYNQIDGLINNEGARRADLTDGQTHEEIQELAPETLPKPKGKPSLLEQLDRLREEQPPAEPAGQTDPPERER